MIMYGVIEQGKHLGRRLGFPTANIAPHEVTGGRPRNGVYACAVWLDGDELAWPGMLNQGMHPTAPEGTFTIEIHLMGCQGDLYGLPVRVEYLRFLRPERRFDDLEALKAQLALDRKEVLDWIFGAMPAGDADPETLQAHRIRWHEMGDRNGI